MAAWTHRFSRSGRSFLVAPATANQIGNFANGQSPDVLGSIYLATRASVLIAPAMNGRMFDHAATQRNLKMLQERGVRFVDPIVGELACGYEGMGKLAAVTDIFNEAYSVLSAKHKKSPPEGGLLRGCRTTLTRRWVIPAGKIVYA